MQFITSTWLKWALDGNGDGVADVQNTYDAATAAAAYLCAGGPMRTDDDLRRGYFSYNHSPAYVEAVLARAHEYQQQVEIPPAD
jgi:membrane-bound lytic murein transglycosylase B